MLLTGFPATTTPQARPLHGELDAGIGGRFEEAPQGEGLHSVGGRLLNAQRAGLLPDYSASWSGQVQLGHLDQLQILGCEKGFHGPLRRLWWFWALPERNTVCAGLSHQSIASFTAVPERKLEIPLRVVLQTTPPDWLMTDEATLWNYAWNHVVFGIQDELDVAEKQLFKDAFQVAKGNGKGTRVGKGARHWTAPAVYCSDHSPYPLELSVTRVDQVAYVWGEYCDKFGERPKKCGDCKMATYKGRPSVPAASATPP